MGDYISRQMHGTNLAKVGTNLATKRTVKGFPIDADLLMLKVEEKYGFRARDRLYEIVRYMPKYELPPADVVPTESQEIGYGQCANAMLKMWMDNVVTDREYNRIMDRLNKLYLSRGEREE